MKKYQRYFLAIIPVVMLMTVTPPVLATAVELSVADSIALALQNNHDLKYAKSAREKAYWAMKAARSNKGLSLDFTHTDQRYNTPPAATGTSTYEYTSDFANQVALTLPLYSGGKLENQIKQAKLELTVADLEVEAAKQQLKLTVVSNYLTVLEYRNEVQVNQETVRNYEEHLQLVNDKFGLGLVAKTDVLSSQVDLASAQDNLVKAQNNYTNAVAALNNAMGLPHAAEVTLKDEFTYEKYPKTLAECLQYAGEHRPELVQYEAKIASANYDVDIAKSGRRPAVNLTAEQGWYDSHFVGAKNSNWLLKLTTSINVFDTGLTSANVKQARHNVDMVLDKAEQQRDTILLNVREYYLSMQEAEKRIDSNKVSVNYAAESLMIQKARYEAGIGTNLDLRDAVLSLDSAQKDYIQALYDYNLNKVKLEQAMGLPVQ
ncbi:TolC family protein [Sporomusa termitida]|uniref:Outer membrane protein TolC n=1 Tax=Sporomusa termitida TaxID=2377 RepID=A0A517DWP6_9FIRM|nr:TolC family protein [Sporomusa termitida]QDR81781.1 Outer membrane protein TolC [Sporomusa termitida]